MVLFIFNEEKIFILIFTKKFGLHVDLICVANLTDNQPLKLKIINILGNKFMYSTTSNYNKQIYPFVRLKLAKELEYF